MEASTLQAPAGLARHRIAIGIPLLRLRSDEQLVTLFRAGHDEAFRVIHDRYAKRLLAYTRQMLPRGHDAEDALQDVFVRAYSGLRSSERELALRAWLFRVAHNRCIDELRRPAPPAPEVLQLATRTVHDPVAEADRRESLRRLIVDVRRLPDQQRSALLMREMGGMSYAELASTLGTSVPAVKSLLVRARIALVQAATARDTACSEIRDELVGAHDRGVRPNANAKRHVRDCAGCRSFKRELRTISRRVAALAPLGPLALLAKTLGFSGGAGAGSSATASGASAGGATAGGAGALGGAAGGGGAIAGGAVVVGTGHVATLLAAAVATAGGAVAISAPAAHPHPGPPPSVQSVAAPIARTVSSSQTAAAQDAAAVAVGVSLLDQSKAVAAAQVAHARAKHRAPHAASASTSSTIPASTAPASTSSTDGTSSSSSSGTSIGTTLNGGTDPNATGTSGSGSTGTSSGTDTPGSTDPGSSSTGTTSSGSSTPGSSTGTSSPGTTNTTNGGSTGPETSPDTGSSTKPSSSGTSTK